LISNQVPAECYELQQVAEVAVVAVVAEEEEEEEEAATAVGCQRHRYYPEHPIHY